MRDREALLVLNGLLEVGDGARGEVGQVAQADALHDLVAPPHHVLHLHLGHRDAAQEAHEDAGPLHQPHVLHARPVRPQGLASSKVALLTFHHPTTQSHRSPWKGGPLASGQRR